MSHEAWLTVAVPVTNPSMRKWAQIALREMQIATRESETTRDRVDTSGDPACTCSNHHDRASNDICIYIGTFDNREQIDSGRADISD